MMLRPVELDAATDPRARKSYKGRLDNLIVIYKVIDNTILPLPSASVAVVFGGLFMKQ